MSSIALFCLAQSCQLPCCNLFTQHAMFVYLSRTRLVNYGPRSNLYHSYIFHCYHLLVANHCYLPHHTVHPLLQQTSEIDNLTVRWGKVLSLCCACLQVASNTFETFPSSYWFDNIGFLLREDLLMCSSHLALGFPNEALLGTITMQGCTSLPTHTN